MAALLLSLWRSCPRRRCQRTQLGDEGKSGDNGDNALDSALLDSAQDGVLDNVLDGTAAGAVPVPEPAGGVELAPEPAVTLPLGTQQQSEEQPSRAEEPHRPPWPTVAEQHAFLDAAKYYRFGQVRELVLANPALVNVQPSRRWSALHQAAQFGDLETVRFLLQHGANVAARTRDGLTPLEVASPAVFDLLLQETLPPQEETPRPKTDEATIQRLHKWRWSPQRGQTKECQVCLEELEEGEELRSLPCAHFFHSRCVDVWLRERSNTCPSCRHPVVA